ncbi:hypothetical protein [Methanocaldococcus sp.]
MISLKIIDENNVELFSVKISSEKLQTYSSIASAVSDALPHMADAFSQQVPVFNVKDMGIMEVAPIIISLLNKGVKGSCIFQIPRKIWETEIKPQIEPLLTQ